MIKSCLVFLYPKDHHFARYILQKQWALSSTLPLIGLCLYILGLLVIIDFAWQALPLSELCQGGEKLWILQLAQNVFFLAASTSQDAGCSPSRLTALQFRDL